MLQIVETAVAAVVDIHTFGVAGQGSSCVTALGSSSSGLYVVAVVDSAGPVVGNYSVEELDNRMGVASFPGQQESIAVGAYHYRTLVGGNMLPSSVDRPMEETLWASAVEKMVPVVDSVVVLAEIGVPELHVVLELEPEYERMLEPE